MKAWLASFGGPPNIDDLRGTRAELAALVRRYGVGYEALSRPDAPDPVSKIDHTAAVYLFEDRGRGRQIVGQMALASADTPAIAADLEPLARRASG